MNNGLPGRIDYSSVLGYNCKDKHVKRQSGCCSGATFSCSVFDFSQGLYGATKQMLTPNVLTVNDNMKTLVGIILLF